MGDRSLDVLGFVIRYKREHDGCAPSYQEIMAGCGISTKSLLAYHLRKLEEDGAVRLGVGTRSIYVDGGVWDCVDKCMEV